MTTDAFPATGAVDGRPKADMGTEALDHLWRYFELHAQQRFTVFNFYTVLIGFATAGLGVALQGPVRFAMLGILLGLLISLLSFVFWKLDQRNSMLIKYSETMIARIETAVLGPEGAIFRGEPAAFLQTRLKNGDKVNPISRLWTFGRSLRLIFLVMFLFGLGGGLLSALRFSGHIHWDAVVKAGDAPPNAQVPGPSPKA